MGRRVGGGYLGGGVVQGSVEERSNGGRTPAKKQIWNFEKAVRMHRTGGTRVLRLRQLEETIFRLSLESINDRVLTLDLWNWIGTWE